MKQFLFDVRIRFGKGFLKTFFALLKLHFDKIRHKDFVDKRNDELVDVIIATVDKDFAVLTLVIESIKNIGHKINKIYIVAPAKEHVINFCKEKNLVFVDELKIFGFGKDSIAPYSKDGYDRRGWIFQQLLKYGMKDFVEQENYLVLESDTVYTNLTSFIENGKFVFFKNTEWTRPYFDVFEKMFGYKTKSNTSFTSHGTVINKKLMNEMLAEIENKNHDKWYNVYQNIIDRNEMSSISDYENWGQWMLVNHKDLMVEKPLYNKFLDRKSLDSLINLEKKYGKNNKTVSFHIYVK